MFVGSDTRVRFPLWMRKSLSLGVEAESTEKLIRSLDINTICESARCPNRDECYSKKTATFLILGDACTRGCLHCSVTYGKPSIPDSKEPSRIREAVVKLGLRHVVITSVTRDDLGDEGLNHYVDVVRELSSIRPRPVIELLTPDFRKTQEVAAVQIAKLPIDIFGHNIETVSRLYELAKPRSDYKSSLGLIGRIAALRPRFYTKSGIMLGMGEEAGEIEILLEALRASGCQMLTLGQYLKSKSGGWEVARYVTPDEFEGYKKIGYNTGFSCIESGPFVRSSYHAEQSFKKIKEMNTHA